LIRKLAKALHADLDELFLLADNVPDDIRDRVKQRPNAFRKTAGQDDKTLDRLLAQIEE
jgi:hypothetical protein